MLTAIFCLPKEVQADVTPPRSDPVSMRWVSLVCLQISLSHSVRSQEFG